MRNQAAHNNNIYNMIDDCRIFSVLLFMDTTYWLSSFLLVLSGSSHNMSLSIRKKFTLRKFINAVVVGIWYARDASFWNVKVLSTRCLCIIWVIELAFLISPGYCAIWFPIGLFLRTALAFPLSSNNCGGFVTTSGERLDWD